MITVLMREGKGSGKRRIRRLIQGREEEPDTQLSTIRATVEHAIAHLKTWRMLSEEGGRYR